MKYIKKMIAAMLIAAMLTVNCPVFSTEADTALLTEEIETVCADIPVEEIAESALADVSVGEAEEAPIPDSDEFPGEQDSIQELLRFYEAPFSAGYAWAAEMTEVFSDADKTHAAGIFPKIAVVYVLERIEYEDAAKDMLRAAYAASGEVKEGYICADTILPMTEEEIAAYRAGRQESVVSFIGEDVLLADTPYEAFEGFPAEESVFQETGSSNGDESAQTGGIELPQTYLGAEGGQPSQTANGIVESITITSENNVTAVAEKMTLQMYASVTPADANVGTVYWSSSDQSVATINNSGVVTTKAVSEPRKVIITATSADGSGANAEFELTVEPIIRATQVVISGVTNEVAVKKSITLNAAVLAGDQETNVQAVSWKIKSGSKYVKIKDKGNGSVSVTGVKAGKATVTATSKDGAKVVSQPFTVVVKSKAASSVKVSSANGVTCIDAMGENRTLALKASVSSSSASKRVAWSVDEKYADIADVTADGVLTVKEGAFGEVVVKASALDGSGKYGTLAINVVHPTKEIAISGETDEVGLNKSITLRAETFGANGAPTIPGVNWEVTSGSKYAKVANNADGSAKVTGIKKGTAIITAYARDGGGTSASYTVYVKGSAVKSVKVIASTGVNFINTDAPDRTLRLNAQNSSAKSASQKVKWSVE
ncbi:MAG: Ig domain-containing protein, partial [Clostridia bacterium]|nr:Ig domain-containing protein [Clostridia bacterium]